MAKKLYLPINLPSKPEARFKLETRRIGDEIKWCVIEKESDEVMTHGFRFEEMKDECDRLEQEFPSLRLTQSVIDKRVDPPQQTWARLFWRASQRV